MTSVIKTANDYGRNESIYDDRNEMSARPASGAGSAQGRAHTHEAPGWTLEDHICRACFGRLVSRTGDAPGYRLYHCTNCGTEASGRGHDVLCCCGTKIRKATASGRSGSTTVDAGIRCHQNPSPTPEFPSLIVASEQGPPGAK